MLQTLLHSPLASLLRPNMEPIGFTPHVLFTGGQQGAWYAPSEAIAAPWYQDSAATTPITAVEQPIGNARDKSGNANHAVQATAAARPILKDTGGFKSMLFDVVDDSLSSAAGGGGTAGFYFCQAIKPTGGAGTVRTIWSDAGANTGYKVQIDATNKLSFSAGNGTTYTTIATAATTDVGTGNVLMVWEDGTNLNAQIGNGAVASVARPVVSAGTVGFTLGKDNGAATSFFNGNIYASVYVKNSGLTAAQRDLTKNYVAQSAGVTL